MTDAIRIVVTGGGTGGHIYPGISIAQTVREMRPNAEFLFVGGRRGLEGDLVPQAGFRIELLPLFAIPRKPSVQLARAGWGAATGVLRTAAILRRFRPHVVVGTGGYVSGPVVMTAGLMRIRTVIQEQNALPGVTTRLLARFATRVALGYEAAAERLPKRKRGVVEFTGNPIRESVVTAVRSDGVRAFGLAPDRRTLLIAGASQGARSINRAVAQAADAFLGDASLQVIHVTGQAGFETAAGDVRRATGRAGTTIRATSAHGDGLRIGNITMYSYLHDMPLALAAADLVVGRSSAITISEILARGLPSIVVPYPFAAENHQEFNARSLERAGAGVVVLDRELNGERLVAETTRLLRDPARLNDMRAKSAALGRPDAARTIAGMVVDLAITAAGGGE